MQKISFLRNLSNRRAKLYSTNNKTVRFDSIEWRKKRKLFSTLVEAKFHSHAAPSTMDYFQSLWRRIRSRGNIFRPSIGEPISMKQLRRRGIFWLRKAFPLAEMGSHLPSRKREATFSETQQTMASRGDVIVSQTEDARKNNFYCTHRNVTAANRRNRGPEWTKGIYFYLVCFALTLSLISLPPFPNLNDFYFASFLCFMLFFLGRLLLFFFSQSSHSLPFRNGQVLCFFFLLSVCICSIFPSLVACE